jgi:hypothetical protein
MSTYAKSLDLLFVSKVRIKALRYFLLHPDVNIHLRGAVREFNEEINAVRRELLRLEEMDFLKVENQGNRKYFKINLDHPFIDELLSMFHKSYGLGEALIRNSKKLGTIDFALLTPAYTRGIKRGEQVIDMAIIGSIDMQLLSEIIREFEDELGRELHYTVLKPNEFQIRRRRHDEFILNMMVQHIVMLIGSHEEFVKI